MKFNWKKVFLSIIPSNKWEGSVLKNDWTFDCFSTIKENVIGKTIDTIVTNNPIILCLPNL